jgi:hypothetical protein
MGGDSERASGQVRGSFVSAIFNWLASWLLTHAVVATIIYVHHM